jgi:hypothetical protein
MSRWFSVVAAMFSVTFGIVRANMGYAGWYIVPLALGATLYLCRWVERGCATRRELVGAGLLAGLAAGMKLRDGVWIATGCAAAIVAIQILRTPASGNERPAVRTSFSWIHLLLPLLIAATLHGTYDTGRVVLFLLPALVLSALLLVRQHAANASPRPSDAGVLIDLGVFGGAVVAVTLGWVVPHVWLAGIDLVWAQMVVLPLGMLPNLLRWETGFWAGPGAWAVSCGLVAVALWALTTMGGARSREQAATLLAAGLLLGSLVSLAPDWRVGVFCVAAPYVLLPVATGLAVIYVLAHWRRPDTRAQMVFLLAVMNVAMTMTLYPWTDYVHWMWASGPALLLATFTLSRLHVVLARAAAPLRWLVVAATCAALAVSSQPLLAHLWGTDTTGRLRGSPSGDVPIHDVDRIQPVVDFINEHVPEGGYILEIPGSLYAFLTGRRQAARLDYFYIIDGTLWDEEQEIEAIRRHEPRFAFVRSTQPSWRRSFPRLNQYLNVTYAPYAILPGAVVLERRTTTGRRRTSSRTPARGLLGVLENPLLQANGNSTRQLLDALSNSDTT